VSPVFSDGNGPLGVYAMLHSNSEALELLKQCRTVFDELVADISAPLSESDRAVLYRSVLQPEEHSLHSVVAVYHEHPSLLSEEERKHWKEVPPRLCDECSVALRKSHKALRAPRLTLDSLSLTADGALIAGFLDDDAGAFTELRASSSECGRSVIGGQLTSRPKSLIHVTLGRLLALPDDLSASQREYIERTVVRYNKEVLPRLVEPGAPLHARAFVLSTLSLVRDEVWPMVGYTELASWTLDADAFQ
jgi:hypothetical protein